MQRDEMIVTQPEQARALQDEGFLTWFLRPASPSDVARSLGIPANLAHHHAKRHAALGLLVEVERESGKVYYQLAAKVFKYRHSLLPVGDPDEQTSVKLGLLRERFLAAYEACDRMESGQDASWQVYSFDKESLPQPGPDDASVDVGSTRPAHFQVRTMSLPSQRYRELVEEIAELVAAAATDEDSGSQPCTLAFMAMDGALQEGSTDSQYVSSFLMNPLPKRRLGDPVEEEAREF